MQNFCIQRFKPLAKDAEFLHHTVVVRIVAKLAESKICRISAFNVFKPLAKIKFQLCFQFTFPSGFFTVAPKIFNKSLKK